MANLYTFPNMTAGPDNVLIGLSAEIPLIMPIFLLSMYMIIFIGGNISQARLRGYADPALWSLTGLMTVFLMALLMSLTAGIINPIVLSVIVSLLIINGLWFFLSRGRFEQ